MKKLTREQVIETHSLLISKTGGIDGLRDEGLLESALNSPFQTFAGEDLYPTLQSKAAQLGFTLVNNHPFIDGNKRIGLLVMMIFLEVNGIILSCEDADIIEVGLSLAAGKMNLKELLSWILEHS